MRGDVVLYLSHGSPFDKVIEWATKGRFVHVEIDLGHGNMVGEHGKGIVYHTGVPGKNTVSFSPKGDIEAGLKWVEEVALEATRNREAHEYGWLDIAAEAFKVLGQKLTLRSTTEWDCSDFVTRYLIAAKAAGPLGKQAEDPGSVSPNDLARAYGVK